MTLKPPLLAFTICALLTYPAWAAKPSNDAAAFLTLDPRTSVTASSSTFFPDLPASYNSLDTQNLLVIRHPGASPDTVVLLNSRPHGGIGVQSIGPTWSINSYAEYTLPRPIFATSLALISMAISAYTTPSGVGNEYLRDDNNTFLDAFVGYADSTKNIDYYMNIGQYLRNWNADYIGCDDGVVPACGLVQYHTYVAPPSDTGVVALYPTPSDSLYYDMQEIRLGRIPSKVTRIRLSSVAKQHICCPGVTFYGAA